MELIKNDALMIIGYSSSLLSLLLNNGRSIDEIAVASVYISLNINGFDIIRAMNVLTGRSYQLSELRAFGLFVDVVEVFRSESLR
jgi:hypothetical protein